MFVALPWLAAHTVRRRIGGKLGMRGARVAVRQREQEGADSSATTRRPNASSLPPRRVVGGLYLVPLAAQAQSVSKMYRVGYLSPSSEVEHFRQVLSEIGYVQTRSRAGAVARRCDRGCQPSGHSGGEGRDNDDPDRHGSHLDRSDRERVRRQPGATRAVAGCLMAYGPNLADLQRRVGMYVDRIARGARPADLPVGQPTKFELSINPKTAQLLGVAIPKSLLAQGDLVQ
jgi:ABC transporter substrate binding protein